MSAREEVLARIRRAQAVADVVVPRAYRPAGASTASAAELATLLEDRLVEYKATVTRCAPGGEATAIKAVLARHRVRRLVVPAGLPEEWLQGSGIERVRDEPQLTPDQLDETDGVVTACALAVAETGTIVLDAGPGQGRRALSLVPDLHVVVVRSDQVVAGLPDALAGLEPTRPQTWISGPSATSDIELDRVEGVHGPRRLEVVLVTA
ncbi:L-lactate dehydrogenase complex protein LldG [Motilibacter rhizosphaerae]|uniref:L-lactate dehydrogenase complex protein LldG n=1 Tax=Motilibacter rhizosphaerae TaxID=598652 RepID=A0A4Q7NV53_9ACTN|nr:LUD domain-containing protein [Motilibacter rhizosphaerae]RZS91067.1 L-lactate dehydrogenase complex protein LldG [Motilibacter rhizosphaerae]